MQKNFTVMRHHILFPRPAAIRYSLLAAFYLLFLTSGLQAQIGKPCPPLWGRVRVVTSFPQFRVRVVTHHPDICILRTSRTPESVGQWQFVDAFEDFTIQFVDAFEDFSIQYVDAFPGIRSPFSRLSHLLDSVTTHGGSAAVSPASDTLSLFSWLSILQRYEFFKTYKKYPHQATAIPTITNISSIHPQQKRLYSMCVCKRHSI